MNKHHNNVKHERRRRLAPTRREIVKPVVAPVQNFMMKASNGKYYRIAIGRRPTSDQRAHVEGLISKRELEQRERQMEIADRQASSLRDTTAPMKVYG